LKQIGYKKYFRLFFAISISLIILLGSASIYATYKYILDRELDYYQRIEQARVSEMRGLISEYLHDIDFLETVPPVRGIIRAQNNAGIDTLGKSTIIDWKERLEFIFASMMRATPAFCQIRYLDATGQELVRVDNIEGKPVVQRTLQNKSDRYYFKEAMELQKGQSYVSPIDLNREFGKIEVPYKPTFRVAKPIFYFSEQPQGVMIVNVFAESFMHIIQEGYNSKKMQSYIFDEKGSFLHHSSEPEREWGKARDLAHGDSFQKLAPQCYENIISKGGGVIHCNELESYIFFHSIAVSSSEKYKLYTALAVSKDLILKPVYVIINFELFVLMLLLIVMGLLMRYLFVQFRKHQELEKQIDNRKFDYVIAKTGDGVIVLDNEWNMIVCNDGVNRLLNHFDTEKHDVLDYLYNRFTMDCTREILLDNQRRHFTVNAVREAQENTKAFYLEMAVDKISNDNNEIENIIFTIRDVTHQRSEQVQKEDFMGLISHKLRTPLTIITTGLSLFEDLFNQNLTDTQKDLIMKMVKSSRILNGMITQLIDYTQIIQSKANANNEDIKIKERIEQVMGTFSNQVAYEKTQINIYCPDDMCLKMNRVHFKFIIKELLGNAISFNDKDAIVLGVFVTGLKTGGTRIEVVDNGPGIPLEEAEKIFDEFYQIEKYFTGQTKGAGLGLATVRRLLQLYEATIDVDSEIGMGSKFVIEINP
jgi:signal transduction histidine kinase